MGPAMRVAAVVLGSGDPRALAAFYQRLLGWDRVADEGPRPGGPPGDGWVTLRPPPGSTDVGGLSFQYEPDYRPPVWPPVAGGPDMMMHLDIAVEDVPAAVAWAVAAGARLADHQPQEHVRVMLDPAGHPFCLFVGGAPSS